MGYAHGSKDLIGVRSRNMPQHKHITVNESHILELKAKFEPPSTFPNCGDSKYFLWPSHQCLLAMQELFRQSAMTLQFSQRQKNFPDGLLKVKMYSLAPRKPVDATPV